MSAEYSRIPTLFPKLEQGDAFTRKLARSSLIRKIAEAQNFLWAHGRVYAAHGYEGNGPGVYNKDTSSAAQQIPGAPNARAYGLLVCTFLVPANWNFLNTVHINCRTLLPTSSTGTVYAVLQDLRGTFITSTNVAATAGINDVAFDLDIPQTGEYQVQIWITFDVSGIALSSGAAPGTYGMAIANVSARFKNDTSTYDTTYFEFPTDFFSNDYPVASVFLTKLIRNCNHLWATRTPELCQASLIKNWFNDSTFTEVARYVSWVSHRVNELKGTLYVNVTGAGGAGNEVRLKVNGSTVQTWTALAAGPQELTVTGHALTGAAESTFTVEVKSSVALADYGVILLGVQLWESGTDLTSPPADYSPIDFNAIEGDDPIIAQNLNHAGQVAGLRNLFNNDKWLAENRLRVLVGDWLHRTYKRGDLFSAPFSDQFDPRVDWTRGVEKSFEPDRPRNITIRGGSTNDDAMGTFPYGAADSSSGYNEGDISGAGFPPFIYPTDLTYNNDGSRLARYNIFQVFTGVEGNPRLVARMRTRRCPPEQMVNDGTGTGPLSADEEYQGKAFFVFAVGGLTSGAVFYPWSKKVDSLTGQDDDKVPFWLSTYGSLHDTAPYTFIAAGQLLPQNEGALAHDGITAARPAGMLFEVELLSAYVADDVLTEADLQTLF